MIVWLLALLLLTLSIYVVYRISFSSKKRDKSTTNHHYTFKIEEE